MEADFKRIVERFPGRILVLAPDRPRFTILAASDSYLRASESEREAIVGRGVAEVLAGDPDHPEADAAEATLASIRRVVDGRAPDAMGVVICGHPGPGPESEGGGFETRWCRVVNSPILGDDGEVVCIVHQVEDVTDPAGIAAQVERTEARRLAILDTMLDPHVLLEAVHDEDGVTVDFVFADANEAACALNGLPYDELIGVRLLGRHPTAGATDLFDRYVRVVETGEPLILDDWSYPQDLLGGEERIYDVRAVRVGDSVSQTWRDVTERHEAAAALAASQQQYRLIAENAADIVSQSDAEGVITWISPSVTTLLGWRPDELVGRPVVELLHPDDLEGVLAAMRDLGEGIPVTSEARVRTAEGGYHWVSAAVRPLLDESGAPAGRVTGWRDIEERVAARRALEAREAELRSVLDVIPDAVFRIDRDYRLVFANEGYARATAGTQGRAIAVGETVLDSDYPADVLEAWRGYYDRAFAGESFLEELSFPVAGGTYYTENHFSPLREGGEVVGAVVTSRDVTARTTAEAALRDAHGRLELAQQASGAGTWDWDVATGAINWTAEMFTLFGLDPETDEAGFDAWDTALHPDDLEGAHARLAAALADHRTLDNDYRIVRPDGEVRWINALGRAVYGADGEPVRVIGLCIDVTGSRQAREEIRRLNAELEQRVLARTAQLEATNRELEEFVYSAAHDLRAPLRAIDGFSQMVADDAAQRLDETDAAHLQRVRAAAQRMAALIDHLMALALASRGDLQIAEVDVSALAESVIRELRTVEQGRAVETVVAPGLRAAADEACLRSVLANLIANAWKFTSRHETARIEVGAAEVDGEHAFFVRDDGAGFEPASAAHIFGAFQRFHDPAEFPGDGIGLATVQRLIARHGGRVWAEGEVEKGATFYFTLPGTASDN